MTETLNGFPDTSGDEDVLVVKEGSPEVTSNGRVSVHQIPLRSVVSNEDMDEETTNGTQRGETSEDKTEVPFHEVLTNYVGEFGRYQILYTLHKSWSTALSCMYTLMTVFLAAEPEHFCDIKSYTQENLNCTQKQLVQMFIPNEKRHGEMQPSQCKYYNVSDVNLLDENLTSSCFYRNVSSDLSRSIAKCDKWNYDTSFYESTIISEWNLVCSKAGLVANANSVYWFGVMAGLLVAGHLADRFGRKPVGIIGYIFFLIFGVMSSFSPNYTFFLATRFLAAMFKTWKEVGGSIASMEIVGESRRIHYFIFDHTGWCVGYFIMDVVAYYERRWRYLNAIIVLSDVIAFILFAVYFRESPRWLVTQGRQKDALKEMKIVAARNRRIIPNEICLSMQKETLKVNVIELLRWPNIRKVTLMMFYMWFSMGLSYYGISLHTGHLGGNPFVTFFISGMADLISGYVALWLYHVYGRVRPYGYGCIAGGLVLVISIFVPQEVNWAIVTTAMVGKFLVNIPGTGNWMFTLEMYPTSIRSIGVHTSSVMARIGAIGASYIGILAHINRALPLLLFGSLSILSGIISLMLPETKGEPLRQTLHDGETFMGNKMCLSFPCYSRCKRTAKEDTIEHNPLLTSDDDEI